jgi:lipopolysaccharide export system protein LptC
MNFIAKLLDWLTIYVPVVVLGLLAFGSYLLVKNTPISQPPSIEPPPKHVPDYFMRDFGVRSFDAAGQLKSEVFGKELRHFPDTDTTEIDFPRIFSRTADGRVSVATAKRAITNADGSEVQLIGDARVVREASVSPQGRKLERLEIRSEFLHAYSNTEQVKTDKPVRVTRGEDSFSADAMAFDNLEGIMELTGRTKTMFAARRRAP